MPTKPLSDELAQEAVRVWLECRRSHADAAEKIGIPVSTFYHRLLIGKERGFADDPAIKEAKGAIGTGLNPTLVWAKTKNDDGTSYSVLLRPEPADTEDVMARIIERMSEISAIPEIPEPQHTSADFLNFIPVFDAHLGMRVGDYGTAEAVQRLKTGFMDVLNRAPPSDTIVILNGGDFTEANDNSAQTPASKHPLAVDTEYTDLIDIATDVTICLIEYALSKAKKVVYKPLRGNHDPATAIAIRQALRQRYKENPRFVMEDGHDVFTYEWEGNLIAAIHGDQKNSKPEALTLAIASRHAEAWGSAKRRELWRGHRHKEVTINVPGMRVYQVNPICPPGRYANENLFTGESDIQCVTYKKGGGRCATLVHIFDDP